jgi:KaiC/GvpD/RAD55 family RecA-like ATPase
VNRIEEILRATNGGLSIFQHELGTGWQLSRNFQNPFLAEKQKTPSFNVSLDGTGHCRFKDFATGDAGDCFDLVMRLHRLNEAKDAVSYIEHELNLPSIPSKPSKPIEVKRQLPTMARPFEPNVRTVFAESELAFWQQSGIDLDELTKFGVCALESYKATRADGTTYTVRSTATGPLYAYDAGNGFWKVYAPKGERKYKFAWPTGQPSSYVFGLDQLPEWSPCILLAAGEKDAMTLSAHGYAAVTVGSETALIDVALVALLRERCDEVLICYDADETGRKRAKEIAAEHGLRWVELPVELAPYGKDATDFYRAVYEGKLRPELLQVAVRNANAPEPKAQPSSATPLRLASTRLRTMPQRVSEGKNALPLEPLWGCLWERPGIAILAGEPGAGKSLVSVHVAHAVSSATSELLGLACSANETVLYYDFELTDRQFESRFSDFPFTEKFIVGDFNPEALDVAFTFDQIAADLEETGAKLLIIDNITALALKTTADADASMAVMRGLKRLQVERGVSSLILAHPPKVPAGVPLSLNHVGGSKHITNFADSVFFIARSEQGPNTRYIKQVKNRTGEMLPGVLVCEIAPMQGHLGFTLIGADEERSHLAQVEGVTSKPEGESTADVAKLRELWRANPNTPQAALGKLLNRSAGWVNKHIQQFRAEPADVHGIHAHPGIVNAVNVNSDFMQAA